MSGEYMDVGKFTETFYHLGTVRKPEAAVGVVVVAVYRSVNGEQQRSRLVLDQRKILAEPCQLLLGHRIAHLGFAGGPNAGVEHNQMRPAQVHRIVKRSHRLLITADLRHGLFRIHVGIEHVIVQFVVARKVENRTFDLPEKLGGIFQRDTVAVVGGHQVPQIDQVGRTPGGLDLGDVGVDVGDAAVGEQRRSLGRRSRREMRVGNDDQFEIVVGNTASVKSTSTQAAGSATAGIGL